MIRRAWVWSFGPGRFGGALLWTLFCFVVAFVCTVALAYALVNLAWVAPPKGPRPDPLPPSVPV